eukprot:gene51224-62633_t
MGIGSSFSTVPIIAAIFVPLGVQLGFSPLAIVSIVGTAGALGDAGSPASDSTLGPTSGLNVDGQHDHIWDTVPCFSDSPRAIRPNVGVGRVLQLFTGLPISGRSRFVFPACLPSRNGNMRLTLKTKVLLLALAPVILFALVLSGAAAKVLLNLAEGEVKETRERLIQESRQELQHYMQIALGSVQTLYDASPANDMATRDKAIEILKKIKYGKDSYFFAYDSQVIRLFRGDSPVDVGKSFSGRKDVNGVPVNDELVRVAKDDSHYVFYSSPLP